MKVDANVYTDMRKTGSHASQLQSVGYDGLRVAELNHDPFLPLAIAAEHTDKIELLTSVAVAFARNPMTMAILAHDLNAFSHGRMILGLGSQVKPHIERRFSMPWYKAAKQMREFIQAMNAIFDCWYNDKRLEFIGEYYEHTLMPSTFTPENLEYGKPRIHLSATGPLMTKVAAEVADGIIMHPFSSEKYIREVTLPAIEEGLLVRGKGPTDFQLDYAPIVATGTGEEKISQAIEAARNRIAFYGSTEAYRPVLEIHGWGDLQPELNYLHKKQKKDEMSRLINDEVLSTIALVGTPKQVIASMKLRFGDVIHRTGFSVPEIPDSDQAELIALLKA